MFDKIECKYSNYDDTVVCIHGFKGFKCFSAFLFPNGNIRYAVSGDYNAVESKECDELVRKFINHEIQLIA